MAESNPLPAVDCKLLQSLLESNCQYLKLLPSEGRCGAASVPKLLQQAYRQPTSNAVAHLLTLTEADYICSLTARAVYLRPSLEWVPWKQEE